MERKTKINAEDGRQDLIITRDFELPLDLLFKAFVDADIVSQWMNTKVIKLESRKYGSYVFETSDPKGNVVFRASGVMHDFVVEQRIIRTFEMEGTSFPVQLEFLEFESLSEEQSKLTMQIVYKSIAHREQMLQLPFAEGINMAHNKLQAILGKKL